MKALASRLSRATIHGFLGNRRWIRSELTSFAAEAAPRRVLEIGSGKPVDGEYVYSMRPLFPGSDFVMSDIEPSFGHEVIDVTRLEMESEFDAVLCVSVIEHVPDARLAVENIHRSLRSGGTAVIGVPFAYPLHDEPADYWRFTEHGLRLLLEPFAEVEIKRRGPRKLPTGLLAFARR